MSVLRKVRRRFSCRKCHGSGVEKMVLMPSGAEVEVPCWWCVAEGRISTSSDPDHTSVWGQWFG